MIDKERAIKIARKTFGLTLTSMPDELYRLINDAVEDEKDADKGVCDWSQPTYDDFECNAWRTDCGEHWAITEGSPIENGMKFCHGCGKLLIESPYVEKGGDE